MKNWELLIKTNTIIEANILVGKLEENLIPVCVLNKQDSNYPVIGHQEIYVPIHYKQTALLIIADAQSNN